MYMSSLSPYVVIFASTMLVAFSSPSPAQITVLISGGFSAAYQDLLPQFEKSTGITVTTARGESQGTGPNTIGAELQRGQPADVVILSREGLDDLLTQGRIVKGSNVDLASVPLGVGVRDGAPRPDISTANAFKQTLLRAKSIGIQSTSATFLKTKIFPQLGIADALADKLSGAGAAQVATGEVEMVVLPVSEILPFRGVDFVGTIPADLQFVQTFSAAVVKGTKYPGASKRLIEFLASDKATPTVEKTGMKRPAPRWRRFGSEPGTGPAVPHGQWVVTLRPADPDTARASGPLEQSASESRSGREETCRRLRRRAGVSCSGPRGGSDHRGWGRAGGGAAARGYSTSVSLTPITPGAVRACHTLARPRTNSNRPKGDTRVSRADRS